MGNACSCCKTPTGESACLAWLFPKKPNLPPRPEPADRPKPVTPTLSENAGYLAVTSWNWETEANGADHNTSEYHEMEKGDKARLVVRRGRPFLLRLATNRKYDATKDKVSLVFSVTDAKNPSFGNGTQVGIMVGGDQVGGWSCHIQSESDSDILLKVGTSPSAIVGEWSVDVDVKSGDDVYSFPSPQTFYLLFNPWCEDDEVFMADEEERLEYVASDTGLIWRGTHNRLRPCSWQFAQYEEDVLQCVLHVLSEVCQLLPAHRYDPVKVVRAISAGVNSPDDSGVLVGNWSGDYADGSSPTSWIGSMKIYQDFYKNKKPVKFGQCWVFSGVTTTACRTLGIPCRPVSNFSSAHDTHNSLTIDYFFDDNGEVIENLNSDSVWNFHAWNEVWMKRADLGAEYDGWQVIDATPQEKSDGQFRCGPASLAAIKNGEIGKAFDSPFVFAEVNADKVYWKYRGPSMPMKLIGKKTGGVGLKVSTKTVGKNSREDITHLYKHSEESKEERTTMYDALRRCENVFARYYLNEDFEDVQFDFQCLDDIVIGQPFKLSVTLKNKGSKDYSISVILRVDSMLYTGNIKGLVKKQEFERTIKPNTDESLTMNVSFDDYYKKLEDQCALNVTCLGKVKENDFEYYAQDDFRVRKPDITIKPKCEGLTCGKEAEFQAYFTNPLPVPLTKCCFYIYPSRSSMHRIQLKEKILPEKEVSCEFKATPKKTGEWIVSAGFTSKELTDVDGFFIFDSQPASDEAPSSPPADAGGEQPTEKLSLEEDDNEQPAAVSTSPEPKEA